MAEPVRDNRFLWGAGILALLVAASLVWIWGVGNNLSTVDQRSRQLEARLAETVSPDAIAAIEARQTELETQIAALQIPDLTEVQQQVDALKTQIGTLQTEFSDFAVPGLDDLVGRLDTVETSMNGLKGQIGDLAPQRVDELSSRLDTLTQQVATLAPQDNTGLADQVTALDGRLSSVEATVTDIGAAVPEDLQGRLDDFAGRLAAVIMPDIGPVETRLGTVEADIGTLKTEIAAAATGEQLSAGLATVTSETTTLSTRIGELTTSLSAKAETAEVTSLADELDAIKQQVAALPADNTATFATQMTALRSELDKLTARVAELPPAAEIATLKDDLTRIVSDPPASRPPQLIERIYFGSSSTSVSDEEIAKVQAIAQRLASAPASLDIVGFSDSQGPAELNRSLSLRRAAAVRLALLEEGVDSAAVLSVTGLGEDAPPVDAGDDADEANNRVVLIYSR